jgi:hypothetical protein
MLSFDPISASPLADDGIIDITVSVTGVQANASIGSISAITNVNVSVTGVESETAAGTIPQVFIALTGVSTTCEIGELFFWSPADVDQTLTWTNISPSDTTWSQITPSGPPVWTEISR